MLPDDARPSDLRARWRAIARRPWVLALGAVLGIVATFVVVDRSAPVYVARADLVSTPVPGLWPGVSPGPIEVLRLRSNGVKHEVARRDPSIPTVWKGIAFGLNEYLSVEYPDASARRAVSRLRTIVDAYRQVRVRDVQAQLPARIEATRIEIESVEAALARAEASGGTTTTQEFGRRGAQSSAPVSADSLRRQLDANNKLLADLQKAADDGAQPARVVRAPFVARTVGSERPSLRSSAAGLLAGLLVGALACLAIERLRDRVRSAGDAARTAGPVPVLGVLPPVPAAVAAGDAELPPAVAALQASLGGALDEWGRVLVVAPADAAAVDEAARVAAALGRAMARGRHRTVVVDADVAAPTLHEVLGVPASPGLAEVATGRAGRPAGGAGGAGGEVDAGAVVRRVPGSRGLWAVPAGAGGAGVAGGADPSAVVAGKRTAALLLDLRRRVEWVVVRCSPVTETADAVTLGTLLDADRCDGVLVVASAGSTTHQRLGGALDVLARAAVPVLGVVVAGADPADCPAFATPARAGGAVLAASGAA